MKETPYACAYAFKHLIREFQQGSLPHQILLFVIACICATSVSPVKAQSAGHSDLTSIEANVKRVQQNDEKFAELNRQHLETYSQEEERLKQLERELRDLYREMKEALDELRSGEFCHGCDKTASELKRRGVVNVYQHFLENGGTYSATPEQIEAKENEYRQKIGPKEEQIRKFKEGDNEFSKKRDDLSSQMNRLKESSDNLREEIVRLSQSYKTKVVAENKSMIGIWGDDLMRIVAQKHYIEDWIDILRVKTKDLAAEEQKAITEHENKVRKQNDADIQRCREKITALNESVSSLTQVYNNRFSQLNDQLSALNIELIKMKAKLDFPGSATQTELDNLRSDKESLESRIAEIESQKRSAETAYDTEKNKIVLQIKENDNKIWDLTINLSKRREEGLKLLRDAFQTKRNILADAITARRASLENTGRLLIKKKEGYRQRFSEYAKIVDDERIRLLKACNAAGAGCYGIDTHGTIVLHWNNVVGCVGEMESNKAIGTYYGCEDQAPVYQQHYNSWMSGMSDQDLSALQRRTSKTKYDAIFRKIMN